MTSGLFGSIDTCLATLDRLTKMDVDEVACLIDLGTDLGSILRSLEYLSVLGAELG